MTEQEIHRNSLRFELLESCFVVRITCTKAETKNKRKTSNGKNTATEARTTQNLWQRQLSDALPAENKKYNNKSSKKTKKKNEQN